MPNNLQYYYKVLNQLGQWLPEERITRLRNLALLIVGLRLSGAIHLGLIIRKWPVVGKIPLLNQQAEQLAAVQRETNACRARYSRLKLSS